MWPATNTPGILGSLIGRDADGGDGAGDLIPPCARSLRVSGPWGPCEGGAGYRRCVYDRIGRGGL